MSSTNRGKYRVENDFYATPEWATEAILNELQFPGLGKHWLEPCAGEGAIIKATNKFYQREAPVWSAYEIDAHRAVRMAGIERLDFLNDTPSVSNQIDVILTNPPFSLAEEFIRKCLPLAPVVIMLLRVDFLGSQKRLEFWKNIPAPDLYVIPYRISFDGKGTDSCEYAWYVWGWGLNDVAGSWKFLQCDRSLMPQLKQNKVKKLKGSVLD